MLNKWEIMHFENVSAIRCSVHTCMYLYSFYTRFTSMIMGGETLLIRSDASLIECTRHVWTIIWMCDNTKDTWFSDSYALAAASLHVSYFHCYGDERMWTVEYEDFYASIPNNSISGFVEVISRRWWYSWCWGGGCRCGLHTRTICRRNWKLQKMIWIEFHSAVGWDGAVPWNAVQHVY